MRDGVRKAEKEMIKADIRRVLIIKFRPFGDVLLTTSYLPHLKQEYPNVEIDYITEAPFDEIIRTHPLIRRILLLSSNSRLTYLTSRLRLLVSILFTRYDAVIDHQSSTTALPFVFLARAKYRIGFRHSKFSRFYSHPVPSREPPSYAAVNNLSILHAFGIYADEPKLNYHVPKETFSHAAKLLESCSLADQEFIAVSPLTKDPRKTWDSSQFAELVNKLGKSGYKILLLGAPSELEAIQNFARDLSTEVSVLPPCRFGVSAAVIRMSRLLICNECAMNHLAVALGATSLVIIGPTSETVWSAQGVLPNHFHITGKASSRRSRKDFGITAEAVYGKVRSILEKK